MTRLRIVALAALVGAVALPAWAHEEDGPASGRPQQLGTVNFPVSCTPAAQAAFNEATALLHSFYYPAAQQAFARVLELDPSCAMGYWGAAMSRWYPLWYPPTEESLRTGKAAADRAKLAQTTERERRYIDAIASFYDGYDKTPHRARAQAYEAAMKVLHERFPEDREASAFYALAMQATIDPNDKTYAKQLASAQLLEQLFAEQPNHPGIAHYIIHAYDYPGLAKQALDAARRYGDIAPAVPHALHMPSHTFTYLGLWEEAIRADNASAATAQRQGDTNSRLHSMDYLVYAYLQSGQEGAAKAMVDEIRAADISGVEQTIAIDYTLAAAPARYAIELRRWSDAAALEPRTSKFLFTEALTHYAKALGAAHTKDLDAAKGSLEKLAALRDTLTKAKQDYWAKQVEIQRQTAAAWVAWAAGDAKGALSQMRAAAEMEDSTYKHPVTPGQLTPARELLADLLIALEQPGDALRAYETTLQTTPRRFNAVYGAARAAELSGDATKARQYYAQLLELSANRESARPELERARMAVAEK